MSKGRVDPSKWRILGFPMGDGQTWTWEEPKARIESRVNGLALTVDPFTRKHDQVHMFDDPKHLYGSTRTFSVSPDRVTVFEVEMGCETYRSNADDLRDAFAGLHTDGLLDWHDIRLHIDWTEDRSHIREVADSWSDGRKDRLHLPHRGTILGHSDRTWQAAPILYPDRRLQTACRMVCGWKDILQSRGSSCRAQGDNDRVGSLHA